MCGDPGKGLAFNKIAIVGEGEKGSEFNHAAKPEWTQCHGDTKKRVSCGVRLGSFWASLDDVYMATSTLWLKGERGKQRDHSRLSCGKISRGVVRAEQFEGKINSPSLS